MSSSAFVTIGHREPMRVREPDARIAAIEPGSIADQLGLRPGDRLLRINDQPPRDVIDYQLWTADEWLELLVETAGEPVLFELEKDPHEDLGIGFEHELFVPLRTCNNGCLFCFVEQAPPGLRPTAYVKDDDYRLSFLHGHFTTLTNLTETHFERIVGQRLSPLYVSVHASESGVRQVLLDNRKADLGWSYLVRLCEAGIECHTQVVLCPGLNDGAHLDRTIVDLAALRPQVASVGVVPVGLTRYQTDPRMQAMTATEAAATIAQIDRWRERLTDESGSFVYAADELYLLAGRALPQAGYYDGFPQVENGIGQTRLFLDAAAAATRRLPRAVPAPRRVAVVTGEYGAAVLAGPLAALNRVRGLQVETLVVPNRLFGGNVKCAGLLVAADIIAAAAGTSCDLLVLPARALNDGGRFLDEGRPADIAEALSTRVTVAADAEPLVRACLSGDLDP